MVPYESPGLPKRDKIKPGKQFGLLKKKIMEQIIINRGL